MPLSYTAHTSVRASDFDAFDLGASCTTPPSMQMRCFRMNGLGSMRGWLFMTALCASGAALAQTAGPPYPPVVAKLIADARAQVTTISIASFKSMLEAKDEGLLIDVREPSEYASG